MSLGGFPLALLDRAYLAPARSDMPGPAQTRCGRGGPASARDRPSRARAIILEPIRVPEAPEPER